MLLAVCGNWILAVQMSKCLRFGRVMAPICLCTWRKAPWDEANDSLLYVWMGTICFYCCHPLFGGLAACVLLLQDLLERTLPENIYLFDAL